MAQARGAAGLTDDAPATTPAVEIVPYDPAWPQRFAEIAARLRKAFGASALRIDHIGSTSVPGLGAKDLIDVQVTVASLEPHEALRDAVERAGFEWYPAIAEDHRPPLDSSDARDWEKRYARDARRVHVHIREAGRRNQRYALLFRDYLRADAAAAMAYEGSKRVLAALAGERYVYADAKDAICDLVMVAAELWVERTGWTPGPPDA